MKPEAHPPGECSRLHAVLLAGRTWRGVVANRDCQGQPIWLQATVVPLRDAAAHGGFVMIGTDVTAALRQRLAYKALVHPGFGSLFAGIGRVLAEGLRRRRAGIGRVSADGAHLDNVGWLEGRRVRPSTVPRTG
jgi:hypothetical protein